MRGKGLVGSRGGRERGYWAAQTLEDGYWFKEARSVMLSCCHAGSDWWWDCGSGSGRVGSTQSVVREGGGQAGRRAPKDVHRGSGLRLPVSLRVEEWGSD